MTVENKESGMMKNRRLRNFDAKLEADNRIDMVVSDANTGEVVVALWNEGAVEAAEKIARECGFEGELREDSVYGRRMFFQPSHPTSQTRI
jgi:hypothetical protein